MLWCFSRFLDPVFVFVSCLFRVCDSIFRFDSKFIAYGSWKRWRSRQIVSWVYVCSQSVTIQFSFILAVWLFILADISALKTEEPSAVTSAGMLRSQNCETLCALSRSDFVWFGFTGHSSISGLYKNTCSSLSVTCGFIKKSWCEIRNRVRVQRSKVVFWETKFSHGVRFVTSPSVLQSDFSRNLFVYVLVCVNVSWDAVPAPSLTRTGSGVASLGSIGKTSALQSWVITCWFIRFL